MKIIWQNNNELLYYWNQKPQDNMENNSTININSMDRATSVVHTAKRLFILQRRKKVLYVLQEIRAHNSRMLLQEQRK